MDRHWIKRVSGQLLGMSFCALVFACGVEGEELFPDEQGKAEVTEGLFTLGRVDQTNPIMEAQIPIEHLGCPMGGIVTMTLKSDDARVKLGKLKYFAGAVTGVRDRYPDRTYNTYGVVLGQGLGGKLRQNYLYENLWLAKNNTTSAAVMLAHFGMARVKGSGCDDVHYGMHVLEGRPHLEVNIELTEGDEAEVSYKVEWFDCANITDKDDPRKQEVCDQVWDVLFKKVEGQTKSVSTCPWLGDGDWCRIWDIRFGRKEVSITMEDVESAVDQACSDSSVILDAQCCD